MPDTALLETFPTPAAAGGAGDADGADGADASAPIVIEHVNEEFTSVCPVTGHPDFGEITVRFAPADACVELKSLKLYFQSFRNEGIYYEAVTTRIRDDLVAAMRPRWLQIVTDWRGRGGICSRVIAVHGDVPAEWGRG